MRIYGEKSVSAAQPGPSNYDLSSRPKTTAYVDWPITTSITQTHVLLYSPDVSSIVSEIVNQAGWTSGNPMGFIIEWVSGSGSRWVESIYTSSEYAAITGHDGVVPAIEVRGHLPPSPPAPPPTPPPVLAYSTWSVESDLNSAEESATTGSMYLTSSDLELPFDGSSEQVIGIVFPSIFLDGASTCLTQEACSTAATSMGLQLGGNGYAFAGNYGSKGCYYYPSGSYGNMAYFGAGGTVEQMATALSGSKARVPCEVANTHLVFDVDEVRAASAQDVIVRIYGELSVSAAQPTSTAYDLSSRTKTSAYVDWAPETSTQTHVLLKTPDISSIVQEIVGQTGWTPGNPMAFIMEHVSGTGSRWVESFYASAEYATVTGGSGRLPALEITGPPPPAAPVGPSMSHCESPVGGDATTIDTTDINLFTLIEDAPISSSCAWSATAAGLSQTSNAWGNYPGDNTLTGCNAMYTGKVFKDFIAEVEMVGFDNDGVGFNFGWSGDPVAATAGSQRYLAHMINDQWPNPPADGVGGPHMKIKMANGSPCLADTTSANNCFNTLAYLNNNGHMQLPVNSGFGTVSGGVLDGYHTCEGALAIAIAAYGMAGANDFCTNFLGAYTIGTLKTEWVPTVGGTSFEPPAGFSDDTPAVDLCAATCSSANIGDAVAAGTSFALPAGYASTYVPYPMGASMKLTLIVKDLEARMFWTAWDGTVVAVVANLPASYSGGHVGLFTYAHQAVFSSFYITDINPTTASSMPTGYCAGSVICGPYGVCPPAPRAGLNWPTWSVTGGTSSAEENAQTGSMYLTSSDLELPFDGSTQQVIGIVFSSVDVDTTSTIANSHLGTIAATLESQD